MSAGRQRSEARGQRPEFGLPDRAARWFGLLALLSSGLCTLAADLASLADEIAIKKRFGPNAQLLSAPRAGGKEAKLYFEDLPGELQNVLRVQLRRPGDVSAVIETPGGFLLYVAKAKTDAVLSVAGLSLPKRSHEQWLEEQSKKKP